ncbi:MAG: hypothetical protein A3K19_26120 [Lentisphaerae bacterium RIFOXYB12_FULL_65_16]|nr:MAG: hypothetical protein A3K18_00440 [Lentisphaerae bacterium RIFOXYA12_64_32]OGV87745.1 MAG: hypothetical protein A3K19_26120 [Lentisphaerae bacterium RIFOXYB12_FULL_65_16]
MMWRNAIKRIGGAVLAGVVGMQLVSSAEAGLAVSVANAQAAVGATAQTVTVSANYTDTGSWGSIVNLRIVLNYTAANFTVPETIGSTPNLVRNATNTGGTTVNTDFGDGMLVDANNQTLTLLVGGLSGLNIASGVNGPILTFSVDVGSTAGPYNFSFVSAQCVFGGESDDLNPATNVTYTTGVFTVLKYYNAITDNPSAVLEDTTANVIQVLANDTNETGALISATDPTFALVTINSVTQPAHGSAAINGKNVTYTPTGNYDGADTFTYTATYVHPVQGAKQDTGTVTVTVNPTNDAPTFTSVAGTAGDEDSVYTYNVTVADIDNANVTITAPTLPGWLTLTDNGDKTATLTGTPLNANVGNNAVTLRVSDDTANTDQSFTIVVANVNDAPVLTPSNPVLTGITEDNITSSGDSVLTILGGSVADVDAGAVKGIAIFSTDAVTGTWQYTVNGGTNWTNLGAITGTSALLLRSDASHKLRFVPDTMNGGTIQLYFYAWDQTTGTDATKVDVSTRGGITAFSTASDTARITVDSVNDAPVAVDDTGTTDEDSNLVFDGARADNHATNVLVNDTDVDTGHTLSVSAVDAASAKGAVVTKTGNDITYNPTGSATLQALPNGSSTTDTFNYTVSDGTATDVGQVTVTVNGRNDAPVAVGNTAETAQKVITGRTTNFSVSATDVDTGDVLNGTDVFVTTTGTGNPTATPPRALLNFYYTDDAGNANSASLTVNANGTCSFTANSAVAGCKYRFDFTVADGGEDGAGTSTATFYLTLIDNEPPEVSVATPFDGDADITAADTEQITINEGTSIQPSVTFQDFTGLTYPGTPHQPQDDNVVNIKFQKSTNNVDWTDLNSQVFTGTGAKSLQSTAVATDNNTSAHLPTAPTKIYVRAIGRDGLGVEATKNWEYTVTDVNTAPGLGTTTGVDITKTGGTGLGGAPGKEDTLTATVTNPNATDADTEDVATLRYRVVWTDNTARATLKTVDLGVGVYTTTLTKAEHAAVRGSVITATVYSLDSQNAASLTSVFDQITIADTAPVGVNDTGTGSEDETLVFDQVERAHAIGVLVNDTDVDKVDGDTLSVSAVDAASAKGAAVTKSGNVITYDPRSVAELQSLQITESTTDTFVYTVADANGGSDTATVTVTVNGLNDKPFWPETASFDGTDANGTAGDTKKYTATVTGDPEDVDHDDVFDSGDRLTATLKIFYKWTNVVTLGVVYMDGDTVLGDFDPNNGSAYTEITSGLHKTSAKDNVPRSETWRVEAFVMDQHGAFCDLPLTVYFGSPQWYPRFSWTAKLLPGSDVADATWYNVQIWNGDPDVAGTLVLDTNVQGTEMTPSAYFKAGSEGLLPSTYYWRYRPWDPVADVYGSTWYPDEVRGTGQISVNDYGHAAKPRDLSHTDNGSGNYTLGFTADNARGYEVNITGPNGYARSFLHVFAPDAAGVISLNQPSELDINLVTPGTYTWDVRGFNPIDDNDGTETWSDTDQIVLAAQGTAVNMALQQPGGLQPPDGWLFRAPGEILLQWDPVPGAAGYLLYLGSSSGHLPFNYTDIGNVTSLRVNVQVGSYFWSVIAYDANYVGSRPSAMARFDVIENAGAPVIQYVRVDADPTVLTVGVAAGTSLPATVDIRHFDAGTGQWRTYLAQPVVGAGTEGTVTIAGADFTDGEYVMISGKSATGLISPNKVLVIE